MSQTPLKQRSRMDSSGSGPALAAASVSHSPLLFGGGGAEFDELPIATMDVEVFERYIMRLLTSLHRLALKLRGAAAGNASTTATSANDATTLKSLTPTKLALGSRGGAAALVAAQQWTFVRRVTRRIEKLCVMAPILERKRDLLNKALNEDSRAAVAQNSSSRTRDRRSTVSIAGAAAAAAGGGDGTSGSTDWLKQSRLQSDLLLVEALITKVQSSVDDFQRFETDAMAALCRR